MTTSLTADGSSILHVNQRPARFRVTKTWEVDGEIEDSLRADGSGIMTVGWLTNAEALLEKIDGNSGYLLTIERLDELMDI